MRLAKLLLKNKALSVILMAIVMAAGCDNSLDSLDEEQGIYSIFGFVDINAEVNYIRVKNLNIPLVKDTANTIDATVTLTNLTNGDSESLQDQVITFDSVKPIIFLQHCQYYR